MTSNGGMAVAIMGSQAVTSVEEAELSVKIALFGIKIIGVADSFREYVGNGFLGKGWK